MVSVGSGAGLPGIPLAILCKSKQFTLLDCNAKKTRFIQQAAIGLGLTNIQVIQQRVENYQPHNSSKGEFNTLVSRAFASSDTLFPSCGQLINNLSENGRIIFMLGKQKQLEVLPNRYNVVDIHNIVIPNLEAQRHIAIVEKK